MGKRGPKKLPTNILILRGSRRVEDRPKNEPKPRQGMPNPPEILKGEALDEWNRKAPLLYEQGTLTLIDNSALAAYCISWALMCAALKLCEEDKLIETAKNGSPKKSPIVSILRGAYNDMVRLAAEFGMTPSGRANINVPIEHKDKLTEAQQWIAKQNG